MWDNNKEKKNVYTNSLLITEINEKIIITEKQNNSYTPPSTKQNLNLTQDSNKKLSTNILPNNLPVCKDPLRNVSRPKQNLYTIFTSKKKTQYNVYHKHLLTQ